MPFSFLDFAAHGLMPLPWWGYIVFAVAVTHVTIACVTIFLHRSQAHRALDLHPAVSHFFRFWLWLTTGMVTKEWVAIHRKHHAKVETAEDPHSPQTRGIDTVFWQGTELYRDESKNQETLAKYGHGTPDDWVERQIYSRWLWQGVGLMMGINLILFGPIGLTIWAIQMIWMPITEAGIINGVGHYWGYRNFACDDASRNIVPWGILIGGEELHNNHHTYPTSAKLSVKPYEFDIGWAYIRGLETLGLAKVRKTPPQLKLGTIKPVADDKTLEAIIANRYEVMAKYARSLRRASRAEVQRLESEGRPDCAKLANLRRVKRWLHRDQDQIPSSLQPQVALAIEHSPLLGKLIAMREELRQLWTRTNVSAEQLVADLQAWCKKAEESGNAALQEFALKLRAAHA